MCVYYDRLKYCLWTCYCYYSGHPLSREGGVYYDKLQEITMGHLTKTERHRIEQLLRQQKKSIVKEKIMNKQSDQTTLNNQSQKNDRNARLRTILQEFREHPNHHASPAMVAALIELETELDANSLEQDQSDVCFQRSTHLMPRFIFRLFADQLFTSILRSPAIRKWIYYSTNTKCEYYPFKNSEIRMIPNISAIWVCAAFE